MIDEPSKALDGSGDSVTVVPAGVRGRQGSIQERRRVVAESLQVGNPGNRAINLPDQADPRHDCQIELRVEDIRVYEHNPRRNNNAKFEEIKESIRSTGIRNPLTVTRRPGDKHFIVEAGGNTRLLALQQLWTETRDHRFAIVKAIFRPWKSEVHVLTAHLIENEQRGDMTFWDKANGVAVLKAKLEEEKGRALSLRQLEEELKAIGFSVNTATLAHYLYATTRLRTLGDAVPLLSGLDVKTIQPRLNLMKRYAQMRGGTGETLLYGSIFEPVFRHHADHYREHQSFNALDLCQACEDALAKHLGERGAQLHMVLDALAQSPQASLEALLATVASARSEARPPGTQATDHVPDNASDVSSANSATQIADRRKAPRASVDRRKSPRAGVQSLKPAHPPDPAMVDRLKASVGRIAQLASIDSYLQFWDSAPFGYYIELPPTPLSGDGQQHYEQRVWWLLALVSGQFHESVRVLLPDTSHWRQLCSTELGSDKGLQRLIEKHFPAVATRDADFFDWLLDGQDEVVTMFWEIATLVRSLRSTTPHPIATSEQSYTSKGNG